MPRTTFQEKIHVEFLKKPVDFSKIQEWMKEIPLTCCDVMSINFQFTWFVLCYNYLFLIRHNVRVWLQNACSHHHHHHKRRLFALKHFVGIPLLSVVFILICIPFNIKSPTLFPTVFVLSTLLGCKTQSLRCYAAALLVGLVDSWRGKRSYFACIAILKNRSETVTRRVITTERTVASLSTPPKPRFL